MPGRQLFLRRGICIESGIYLAGRFAERDYHPDGGADAGAGEGEHRVVCSASCDYGYILSTGMLKKLSEELIKGGYEADTPAAIVYKATWPDEKRVVCTVATLAEAAERENIKKTALIIVGDVTAQAGYERSRLYAPEFTTEFRQGTDGFVYE